MKDIIVNIAVVTLSAAAMVFLGAALIGLLLILRSGGGKR